MTPDAVDPARLQFAFTAMAHFLFVPLSLGLAVLLAIMESVFVMTGKAVYREMTQFWARPFAISFALGVATGLPLEYQFGTHWAAFARFGGDVFGLPLALEGLMAFLLESTFIGLFFLGWQRLGRLQHLGVTWLLAIGSNLSAFWILIANAWMQHPVGARLNPETLRMELSSFAELVFNPVAQVKFVHTVAACYVTGASFVLAVSAWYLLRGRVRALARRSFAIAAAFGLAAVLSVITLGDESGYELGNVQKVKLAAIESMWETGPPPAPFTLFGIPDEQAMRTDHAVRVPWLLGLIATRSIDRPVTGLKELIAGSETRIRRGLIAYEAGERLRAGERDAQLRAQFERHAGDYGYALLLKRYVRDPRQAGEADIARAARDTVPRVWPLFWGFRIMVGCSLLMLGLYGWAFVASARDRLGQRGLLRAALWAWPLPWIASQCGWLISEYGRQPWTVAGLLPTFLAASAHDAAAVTASLGAFIGLYALLFATGIFLIVRCVRRGPEALSA
ncbi:MAG: cytochrome ubiquinol oxidase subunit I [Proteobacteria bacterium]|nr:cytochrome ubiquinol oxidase subunit I [Pseudomonadota bacterium]HMZ10835.1 cytochrome ubiquinol oxidase subunit I [Plasticicumulans sp.]HND97650.1 cytochrome ubiquinol oxidase subunit I [Plasticicumulans sp.]HNI22654.1 cytochrome ubiquinol oxidase subunit I [Plasticicumulans sp.]HNJ08289.1 cytochrome ubiquinol oxidase subunit I [Plasticicumulans sp.]